MCFFKKPEATHMGPAGKAGKRGAAELARSAQPAGGVSPSLLLLVRLKLGSISAELQTVRCIRGTGAGAEA